MKSLSELSRRSWVRNALCVVSVAWATGCLSPTLPLPPPSDPIVSAPDETGEIVITGRVTPRASVFVQNDRTDEIVGEVTGQSGRYEVEMQAEAGDLLFVWEKSGTTDSPATEVVVPAVSAPQLTDPVGGDGGASAE